jgi:hypothetical protein
MPSCALNTCTASTIFESECLLKGDGINPVSSIKINHNALVAPATTDDSTQNYVIGSRWIDIIDNKEYVCVNNIIGAAIWVETTKVLSIFCDTNDNLQAGNSPDLIIPGTDNVIFGCNAGSTNTIQSVRLGSNAGSISVGGLGTDSIAIGYLSGRIEQNIRSIAIGTQAGENYQNQNSIAIGYLSGYNIQNTESIAIGTQSGNNIQGMRSIAIGHKSGMTNQGDFSVAVGYQSGSQFQDINCVAIGFRSGETNQGTKSIAIGSNSGSIFQGDDSVSIGYKCGNFTQGNECVAIGYESGYLSQQNNSISIGYLAGRNTQGTNSIAIGHFSGITDQGNFSTSIGSYGSIIAQGQQNQGDGAVCLGYGSGRISQGNGSIAIGYLAGETLQGNNAIAIGNNCVNSSQQSGSICINASSTPINVINEGLYIDPIKVGTSSDRNGSIFYNTSTNEVIYIKNNLIGTTDPTINDDSSDDYSVGSIWIDTTPSPDKEYICTNNTISSARWVETTKEEWSSGLITWIAGSGWVNTNIFSTVIQVGKVVTLTIWGDPVPNPSSSTVITTSTFVSPVGLIQLRHRPLVDMFFPINIIYNGTAQSGMIQIKQSDGQIIIGRNGLTTPATFGTSGKQGWMAFSTSYVIN